MSFLKVSVPCFLLGTQLLTQIWRCTDGCMDTFLHADVQNPLGLCCGRSLPTFPHGTEPLLFLFTLNTPQSELSSGSSRENPYPKKWW